MDLRRFLVIFVLVFFILSTNIYSSSIFGIENITLPDDIVVNNYDYIVGYSHSTQQIFVCYYIGSHSFSSFHVGEDGVFDESGNELHRNMRFITYIPSTGEWSNIGVYPVSSVWSLDANKPLFSNKNVYLNDEIYIFGKEYYSNLGVFGSLSSSIIFSNLLKPLLKLMPYVLVFIILLLTFIKAWNFIKGVFL